MREDRWGRAGRIFEDIWERPHAEWSRYLDKECASDPKLRSELKRLLGQHILAEKSRFLETQAAPPEGLEELAPGQRIGHYCIQCELGRGGMGIVYKARDTQLGRNVALKILAANPAGLHDQRQRLLKEAKSASALNHPNIVSIYEAGSQDGVHFIAMEYVEGKTLRERIPRRGMRAEQAVQYAMQIAAALAAAHQSGIIHRDLKPENIMISENGVVKLLDFGLATWATRPRGSEEITAASQSTAIGLILGTVNYMSPEQAEGAAVDSRSDIFSFGSALYEMTTGRRAFSGHSPAATLGAVVHCDPMSAEAAGMIPAELKRIIGRCLEKRPSRRFQQMSDVREALAALCDGSIKRTSTAWRRWVVGIASVLVGLAFAQSPSFKPLSKTNAVFEKAAPASKADYRELALRDFRAGFSEYGYWSPNQMNTALNRFLSTIQVFPEGWQGHFGLAKARLAETLLSGRSFSSKQDAILANAIRAVELGPEIAVTHSTLAAALLLVEWKWADAEREVELGIRWNPQNGEPCERRGQIRVLQGRFAEASRDFARALDLRPDFDDCRLSRAWGDFSAGDFELAIARVNDVLPGTKKKEQAYRLVAAAYGAIGEFKAAEEALAKAWLPPIDRLNFEAWIAARKGDPASSERILEKIEALCQREDLKYCDTALAETALGHYDHALKSLEQGLRLRHWKLLFYSVDPRLKPLHNNPRWAQILTRVRNNP